MNPSDHSADHDPLKPTLKGPGRWFWPSILLTLAGGAVSMGLVYQMSAPTVAAPLAAPTLPPATRLHPVELVTVELQRIEDLVKVNGTIHPVQEAAIAAQVGGIAESVAVRPGDYVEAGQLLVEVGTTDLQLLLDQQRTTVDATLVQLRAAEATLERTRLLADQSLTPRTTLEAARAEFDRLSATVATQLSQVEQAETNLRRARVIAPFAGIIASRTIEPGQIVSPGTPMLSIVDLSTVRVEVMASLKDSASVTVGQPVRLLVQGMPEDQFSGVVERVSPVSEAGTRSIKVYLSLDNGAGQLRGGMFVTGEIIVGQADDVLAVPVAAIHRREDATYVMAIVEGTLYERPIETGESWPAKELIEARSGIAAGDIIVGTNLSGLTDGAPIIVEGN